MIPKPQEGGHDKTPKACKIMEVYGRHYDPDCPQCRLGLRRLLELSEALYDELEHAVGMYRMPLEDHCNHTVSPIRSAIESDLDRILEIERLSFEKQWEYGHFLAALKGLFLVFDEKEILGFLIACYSEIANHAVILRIAVHPDHRGKGIASRLIGAALDYLKEKGIREVKLTVEIVRRGAIGLYEKLGFKIYKVVPVNFEENEEFYTMALRLDNT